MEQTLKLVNERYNQFSLLKSQQARAEEALALALLELQAITEARAYINQKAKESQDYVKADIEVLINQAVAWVFPESDYTVSIEFVPRRNTTEADILIREGEHTLDPVKNVGGGISDIVAFALQIIALQLAGERKCLILDQPFSNIDQAHKEQAYAMVKGFSDDLGIQIIATSHDPLFKKVADKLFEVTKVQKDGWKISQVQEVV